MKPTNFHSSFYILHFTLFILLILISSCKQSTEPVVKPELKLELEDVSCTEAWIKLSANNLKLPAMVSLIKDGTVAQTISLWGGGDTTLYVDSLLPRRTYKFTALLQQPNNYPQPTTNHLQVTTMDTTSHNFTFEMITFGGEIGSSVLFDVAIINENNIWAVGDIWIRSDTSETGYVKYNAVHWNGSEWKLKRIMFYTICGREHLGVYEASSVLALNENEVLITLMGDQIAKIRGTNQVSIQCLPFSFVIKELWGTSHNNLYAVGYGGNIVWYNGSIWKKIESNTTLNINDIWGDYNEKTGEWEILAVASNRFFDEGAIVLKIEGLTSKELNKTGLPWSLSTVWFKSGRKYFIGGDGLYMNKKINEGWKKDTLFIPIYKDRIRGININDIVVSGSNGLLSHFNGYNWKHYINNELPYYSGRLLSVDIKQNVIVAVGLIGKQAIITIGRR